MDVLIRILIAFLAASILTVGQMEVAVVHQRIGGDPSNYSLWPNPLGPGTYLIIPIVDEPIIYPTKRQVYTFAKPDAIAVQTQDKHEMLFEISVVYSVDPYRANTLYQKSGTQYVETFINSTVRAIIRSTIQEAINPYTEEGFYRQGLATGKRAELQQHIALTLASRFQENGLFLYDALIRNVLFSDAFVAQIEAEQIAQATATAQASKR